MNLTEAFIMLIAYVAPICFFVHIGLTTLLRDPGKTENRLASLVAFCYLLLFTEELVRYLLPIEYSPKLTALWFSNVGIAIPGLGFHFLAKFAEMDKRMPKFIYPYIFYVPLLVIPLNIFNQRKVIVSEMFVQAGIWKWPVYNAAYYGALTVSITISLLYFIVLVKGRARAVSKEHQAIYHLLIAGVVLVFAWQIAFGYFRYGELLPPYPYLYGGMIWCGLIWIAMQKYDFLDFSHKRYEKLFNLNPVAIMLVERSGRIREANPSARKLFNQVPLGRASLESLAGEQLQGMIQGNEKIMSREMQLHNGGHKLDVLVDGDYVFLNNTPHVMLIIRDITLQKAHQEQIAHMAYHDYVTDLPNRRMFYERIGAAIRKAGGSGQQLALIVVQLLNFKQVNEQHGYDAGEELLRHVAIVMKESVGLLGTAARLEGDKFVLLIEQPPSATYVTETVHHLQASLDGQTLTSHYSNEMITIRAEVGCSYFPRNGMDINALIRSADKAARSVAAPS